MFKISRVILGSVLLLTIGVIFPPTCRGSNDSHPTDRIEFAGHIADSAQVLSTEAVNRLNALCSSYEYGDDHLSIAIVTARATGDEGKLLDSLAKRWGAEAGTNRTALILVDTDKNWRISIGRGIETHFDVSKLNAIGNDMAPALSDGNYSKALYNSAIAIGDAIHVPVMQHASAPTSEQDLKPVSSDNTHPTSTERLSIPMPSSVVVICIFAVCAIIVFLLASTFTVRTMDAVVIERFSKFNRIAGPGFHFKLPFIERTYTVDLQVKRAVIKVEAKTKDNVFVMIPVSVQYQVLPDKVFDAFYKLSEPVRQIESYVFNAILGYVPKLTLDETFDKQATISEAVKKELDEDMAGFGYSILKALVTDIMPDEKVKSAMNDINAAQREQEAAKARGEAQKIVQIAAAEAEARSKELQGEGVAKQRKAIIEGLKESVKEYTEALPDASTDEVMKTVLLTQYFDTLREIGANGKATTIMLPNSPGTVNDLMTQLVSAAQVNKQ